MEPQSHQATRIRLFSFEAPHMRTFHLTWMAFFLSFFSWFGIAPLMPIVRDDLGLTRTQIGNTIIASVAATIFVRLFIGPLCDRYGPRRVYAWLLTLGSLPVMGVGFADSYEALLLFRLAIGAIGASFVITQCHTTLMFAPNCVGTANATTAGWGNLGGGVTQMVMPLVLTVLVSLGVEETLGWRLAMVVPGVVLFLTGLVYARFTQDTPEGNFADLDGEGDHRPKRPKTTKQDMRRVLGDYRVWALFIVYAACFGVELTVNNVAALYFHDEFNLDVTTAGLIAGLFGLMNIFARTLGGVVSDRAAMATGLNGRVKMLALVLAAEAVALMIFSRMTLLPPAVAMLVVFSLFVQMAEGATFGVVPFVNRRALGMVAGVVGAGGNAGAVLAGFLFRSEALTVGDAFLYLGMAVGATAGVALTIRFQTAEATMRTPAESGEITAAGAALRRI